MNNGKYHLSARQQGRFSRRDFLKVAALLGLDAVLLAAGGIGYIIWAAGAA